jgi:hypothetical protein
MQRAAKLIGLMAYCSAAACGTSSFNVGSKFIKSQSILAAQGGILSVGPSESATYAGTQIEIPPNALAQDATITVAEGIPVKLPTDGQVAGPVADFGPAGTSFSTQVLIRIPFVLSGLGSSALEVQAVASDGTVIGTIANSALEIDAVHGTVSFLVSALASFGAIAVPPACGVGQSPCNCPGQPVNCQGTGVACELVCPIQLDGGACPPGEYLCPGCPGAAALCVADNSLCVYACPAQDAGTACPPGDFFCPCLGECIVDTLACPLCEPRDGGVGGGDAGPCPPGDQLCPTCTGGGYCAPDDTQCVAQGCPVAVDGGIGWSCPDGGTYCPGCDGNPGYCLPRGVEIACVLSCPQRDGGVSGGDGGAGCPPATVWCAGLQECILDTLPCPINGCPPGGTWCPSCNGYGYCTPPGASCPGLGNCPPPLDAGSGCPGEELYCPCTNQCLSPGSACPQCVPADGGPAGCPPGETSCGCGGTFVYCIPDGGGCPLGCPQRVDAG